MLRTALKDTYLLGTTPTTLINEVPIWRKMYYDIETHIMVNQSVNEFYTRWLFRTDYVPQDVAFTLDISTIFFNNFSHEVREFLISEGVQAPPSPPTENNNHGNYRLFLVRNAAVEVEKKIITIKSAVQPAIGRRHPKTFMGMIAGNPSKQITGLGSSFQFETNNYMVAEANVYSSIASATIELFVSNWKLLPNPVICIEGFPAIIPMNVLGWRLPIAGCTAAFIVMIFFSTSTAAFLTKKSL